MSARPRKQRELFYWDGPLAADAELHRPILEAGDVEQAESVSKTVAARLGLSAADIAALYSVRLRQFDADWDESKHPRGYHGRFGAGGGWQLPPAPGTTPIPEGHVRLYHQTSVEHLGAIKHQGLRLAMAKGIEGPKAIYASTTGFYGKPGGKTPTIEFHVAKERWDPPFVRVDSEKDQGRVAPENIIAVHYPWHEHARYAEQDPRVVKNILAGEHDALLTDPEYGKSVRYIKHKFGGEQIVYHGSKKAGFEQFHVPDPRDEFMIDRTLGVHVAKDPKLAESFTHVRPSYGESQHHYEGGVYILRIPTDSHFLEVDQPLLPYVKAGTPKTRGNVYTDEVQIGNLVYKTAFAKDPDLFARYLERRWQQPATIAKEGATAILNKQPWSSPDKMIGWSWSEEKKERTPNPVVGLDDYVKREGVLSINGSDPQSKEDRVRARALFLADMQTKGYIGLKYINTSPMEMEEAKDPTSYVVFDPATNIKFKYRDAFPLSWFEDYDPNEERDYRGRWTAGGGGSEPAAEYSTEPYINTHFEEDEPERSAELRQEIKESFPRGYNNIDLLNDADDTYNCYSWALGKTDKWAEPEATRDQLRAAGAKEIKVSNAAAYSEAPKPGMVAIAEYFDQYSDPKHMARQLSNGRWTSKLGASALIEHELGDLEGERYGKVKKIFQVPRDKWDSIGDEA